VDVNEPAALAEREAAAGHALAAYRERRRRRRGEDTYFGSAECLLGPQETDAPPSERSRRRIEVMNEAAEAGMPGDLADLLYEVALEEGVDPALAYDLVRSGLGVCPPAEGLLNAPEHPTTDKYRPEWLTEPIPPDILLRERMLRLSFRRLRRLLESHDSPDEAFRAFAREPDVGQMGY
jgi:hypothetical protein